MDNRPLVSVCCITYNHAPFISRCIEGFLMQKTSFPFEIIINDDCSTDGTTEILKQYAGKNPNLIRLVLHDENQFSKGVRSVLATFVYPLAKGKYIALCEGDDYWIDPYKLQKQVDFMESHDDVSLVFSRCHVLSNGKYIDNEYPNFKGIDDCYFNSEQIYTKWMIPTATILCRSSLIKTYIDNRIYAGDIVLNLSMAEQGKVFGMSDYTAVYRINEDGLTLSRKKETLAMWERYVAHIQFLSENFTSVPKRCYNKALQNVYCNIFNINYDRGICDYKSLLHIFRLSPLKAIELAAGKFIIRVFHLNKGSRVRSLYRRFRYPQKINVDNNNRLYY